MAPRFTCLNTRDRHLRNPQGVSAALLGPASQSPRSYLANIACGYLACADSLASQLRLQNIYLVANVFRESHPLKVSRSIVLSVAVFVIGLMFWRRTRADKGQRNQVVCLSGFPCSVYAQDVQVVTIAIHAGFKYAADPRIRFGLNPTNAPKIGDLINDRIVRDVAPLFRGKFCWGKVWVGHLESPFKFGIGSLAAQTAGGPSLL